MEYQLGDIVVAISPGIYGGIAIGELGTVIAPNGVDNFIGVDWGRRVLGGHECGCKGKVPEEHCTWVSTSKVRLLIEDDDVFGDIVSTESMI